MEITTSDRYKSNLRALSVSQPELVDLIERTSVPTGARAVVGRDGRPTYLVSDSSGRSAWLGGSSMPSVSAEESLIGAVADQGNVVLPGVLSGLEPLQLAGKLPGYSAVFVIEDEPAHIKLAMQLYDYAAKIENGRLLFFRGAEIESDIAAFFERNHGYEMPTRMQKVAQKSPSQIATLQRRLERAGARIVEAQAKLLSRTSREIVTRISDRSGIAGSSHVPEEPRIAVISTTAGRLAEEQAGRMARALAAQGWVHCVCIPDSPRSCHAAARLSAIHRVQADVVVFINSVAGPFRSLLPPELPVVSWFSPGAAIPAGLAEPLGPHDLFFAASPTHTTRLVEAGVPRDRIERLEVGADVCMADVRQRAASLGQNRVGIMMDLPDDRPEAAEVSLPSHLTLWRALQRTAESCAADFRQDRLGELFDQATRTSGISVSEPSLRDQFHAVLRTRILPVAMAIESARALARVSLLNLWGSNWTDRLEIAAELRGPIPHRPELATSFGELNWLVLPVPGPANAQLVLDALSAGVRVAIRAGNASFEQEHPRLAELGPFIQVFRNTRELLKIIRSGPPDTADTGQRAASLIHNGHTLVHRLRAIVDRLRNNSALMARDGTRGVRETQTCG